MAYAVASSQIPQHLELIRPLGVTAVASIITNPAPDVAMLPMCMWCQALILPSSAMYVHMGGMTIRLDISIPRSDHGVNSFDSTGMTLNYFQGLYTFFVCYPFIFVKENGKK